MLRVGRSIFTSLGIVVLLVAVLGCMSLAVALMDGGMSAEAQVAIICCFVVTLAVSLWILAAPVRAESRHMRPSISPDRSLKDRLLRIRPPDPVELGALLI